MRYPKTLAAVALVLAAGAAQARGNDAVQWSITIGAPAYSQPYPVYSQPYPVYSHPVPVYRAPSHYPQSARWDRDRDGIPDRYDRVYNPRWDRDGDGVPNRYERHQRIGHDRDRDRDGIPDWRDRNDGRRGR